MKHTEILGDAGIDMSSIPCQNRMKHTEILGDDGIDMSSIP